MKKISQLLKEFILEVIPITHTHTTAVTEKKEAEVLEKAWFIYQKEKKSDTQESHKQRESLYQFMHFQNKHNQN